MSRLNDPATTLPYFIRATFREIEKALTRFIAPYLPLSQFYVLRLEWSSEGETTIDVLTKFKQRLEDLNRG